LASDGYAGARDLASWIRRVRGAWPGVRVSHVEAGGIGDAPELGQRLDVRAVVGLGELTPDDVRVQVAFGPVDENDELREPTYLDLAPQSFDDAAGSWFYEGGVPLDRRGAFGYTVRVLPDHRLLEAPLDLVAFPPEESVYTTI
jgi:starch phosphorylase